MKEINNEILSEFCNRLIDEMEEVKEAEEIEGGLDIPFWISVLNQKFSGDISDLSDFVEDLERWNDYLIFIDRGIFDACIIKIELRDIFEYDDYYSDYPDYNYEIRFDYDERYIGYCECTPQDKGYREDKECCGEICDWDAPKFSLHKITNITSYEFDGEQKDCWKFEDEFNKSRKELSDKKDYMEIKIDQLSSYFNNILDELKNITKQMEEM